MGLAAAGKSGVAIIKAPRLVDSRVVYRSCEADAHAKTIQSRFGTEHPPHRHEDARQKTDARLSGALFAGKECRYQNVQRLPLWRKGRCAASSAKIQTHRDGSRSKARRQSQISASTPSLKISFAPDFPALEKRGRKIPRSRLGPSINNAWREQLSGFNLVWGEPQVSIVRSTVERNEFAIRPL